MKKLFHLWSITGSISWFREFSIFSKKTEVWGLNVLARQSLPSSEWKQTKKLFTAQQGNKNIDAQAYGKQLKSSEKVKSYNIIVKYVGKQKIRTMLVMVIVLSSLCLLYWSSFPYQLLCNAHWEYYLLLLNYWLFSIDYFKRRRFS